MEAIFTTTGMQLKPYRPTICKPVLLSRSLFSPKTRTRECVTAYVSKDIDGKRLLTYNCHPDWLESNLPQYEQKTLPPNTKYKLEDRFSLNPSIIPSEIQSDAVNAIMENGFKTAFFNIPTGEGKTLLAIYLVSLLKVKGWAMCYRSTVLDQWKNTLTKMTDFDSSRVKIIRHGKELLQMANGEWDPHQYDIYLSTPRLLVMFAEKYGFDLLNDAMDTCGIGVKFFDEAHRNVGNICKINALTNIDRTYYLSADFGQSSPEREALYYKMLGKIPVIKPSAEQRLGRKYTNGVLVRYDTHPTLSEVESVFAKYGFNHFRFMEYQHTRPEYFDAIEHVLEQCSTTDTNAGVRYRMLLLCNLISQVDSLAEFIKGVIAKYYPANDLPHVSRYHSQLDEDDRMDALNRGEIIVSTYQSMGVGVDLKGIRYVLSLVPVNIIDDNQAAGRARALPSGEDCYYFMFIDDGFEYVRKRLPDRLNYLKDQKLKQIYSVKYS